MSVLHSPCLERFMDIALDFGTGKTYPMFSFELAMRSLCYAREFFSEGRRPENGAKLDLSSSMAIIKQYGFEVDVDAFFRELVGGDHHDNKWKRLMPLDWGRLVLADRLEVSLVFFSLYETFLYSCGGCAAPTKRSSRCPSWRGWWRPMPTSSTWRTVPSS